MSFYNTTSMAGDELRSAITSAKRQEDAVLAVYAAARAPLSPSDVWKLCERAGRHWPLTSIRRAITSLTQAGALTQTGCLTRGLFGKPEHRWERMERAT